MSQARCILAAALVVVALLVVRLLEDFRIRVITS